MPKYFYYLKYLYILLKDSNKNTKRVKYAFNKKTNDVISFVMSETSLYHQPYDAKDLNLRKIQ